MTTTIPPLGMRYRTLAMKRSKSRIRLKNNKAATFDSPIRDRVFLAISEFGIPAKLIRLCRRTLSNFSSSVKVGMDLFEPFNTVRGSRQGDPLSCNFFSIVMESVLQKAEVHRNATMFQKSLQLLVYADDIDIVVLLKGKYTEMALAVNENKMKYMLSTIRAVRHIGS